MGQSYESKPNSNENHHEQPSWPQIPSPSSILKQQAEKAIQKKSNLESRS